MPLITLVLYLALVGLVVWLVTSYIPMDPKIRQLIIVVVVVLLVIWVLQLTGVLGLGPTVPRLR